MHVQKVFFLARSASIRLREGEGKCVRCRCERAKDGAPASPEASGNRATCPCAGEGLSTSAGEGLSTFLRAQSESVSAAALPAASTSHSSPKMCFHSAGW